MVCEKEGDEMKRLFKPMSVCLGVAIPIFLLAIYWLLGVKNVGDERIFTTTGMVLIFISGGIVLWGYSKREKDELSKTECMILMGLSLALGIGMIGMLAYGASLLIRDDQDFIVICVNIGALAVINLISCVAFSYSIKEERKLGKYIIGVVGLPFIIYFGLNIVDQIGNELLVIVFVIGGFYSLLLLILQVMFILKRDKGICFFPRELESRKVKTQYWVSTFLVLIVLPYLGLVVNNIGRFNTGGIVGDFSHPIFWVMPLINGLAFMVILPQSLTLRKIVFYIRCVGCTFILYFFVSFIPLMPFGVIGIILYGLGLLAFIPTLAIIWEVCYIAREAKSLFGIGHKRSSIALLVVGLLTLPILFAGKIGLDRQNFNTAIRYVNGKEMKAHVYKEQLAESLDIIERASSISNRDFIVDGRNTPILSYLYIQSLTKGNYIDENTFIRMKALFFNENEGIVNEEENTLSPGSFVVQLKDVSVSTTYDEKQDIYRSWIDLTLENTSDTDRREYAAAISLPDNAYVSDYYLVVGEEKKKGILADKRAATSIYQEIVRRSLDPGLLKYLNDETLELRVFPFGSEEIRQTGFEVIHTGATTLTIGDYTLELKAASEPIKEDYGVIKAEGVTILSADYIKTLPKESSLLPRYYFLIDGSKDSDREALAQRVQNYMEEQSLQEAEVWVVEEGILSKGIENITTAQLGDGGYNLNGALQQILREEKEGYYPVVIAVVSNFSQILKPYQLGGLAQKYPQSSYYYELNEDLSLRPHVLSRGAITYTENTKTPLLMDVRSYEGKPVLNAGKKQFIYTGPLNAFQSTQNAYKDGCLLEAMSYHEGSLNQEKLLQVVKGSFATRLLTQQTAFIVVETKEQEEQLFVLQEEYLSGNAHNSAATTVNMSEPSLILCAIMLLAYGGIMESKGDCPGNAQKKMRVRKAY